MEWKLSSRCLRATNMCLTGIPPTSAPPSLKTPVRQRIYPLTLQLNGPVAKSRSDQSPRPFNQSPSGASPDGSANTPGLAEPTEAEVGGLSLTRPLDWKKFRGQVPPGRTEITKSKKTTNRRKYPSRFLDCRATRPTTTLGKRIASVECGDTQFEASPFPSPSISSDINNYPILRTRPRCSSVRGPRWCAMPWLDNQ